MSAIAASTDYEFLTAQTASQIRKIVDAAVDAFMRAHAAR